jgi:hypothetical protein
MSPAARDDARVTWSPDLRSSVWSRQPCSPFPVIPAPYLTRVVVLTAAGAARAGAGFGKVFCRPGLWQTSRNCRPRLSAWPRLTRRTQRTERTQVLGNLGWLFCAGGDFPGTSGRVWPHDRTSHCRRSEHRMRISVFGASLAFGTFPESPSASVRVSASYPR